MSQSALTILLRSAGRALASGVMTFVLGATALAAPTASAAPLVTPLDVLLEATTSAPSALETHLFTLTNADRLAHGFAPLVADPSLVAVARWRSQDMAVQQYFSHDIAGVAGDYVFRVLREYGVTYRVAGENLAFNYFPGESGVAQAEVALMDSPTHQANILRPDYTHLGVGVAIAADGRVLYTQLFRKEW